MIAQNIYDNPEFFEQYSKLRQKSNTLNATIEQPALENLLFGTLEGKNVLDLGCGFGNLSRFMVKNGAAKVIAVDVSSRMLDEACKLTTSEKIVYINKSIETFEMVNDSFDLIISSLVLHYISNYSNLVTKIAKALRKNGRFIFSIEHPICTALATNQWMYDDNNQPLYWPVDHYDNEGERKTNWFIDGVIKYHRTLSTYVNTLVDSGLTIAKIVEPQPTSKSLQKYPELEIHRRRPPFLIIESIRIT
jgi:SAM-dependent methyltransferase